MPKKINVVSLSNVKDDVESANEPHSDEAQLKQIKEEIKKEEETKPAEVIEVKPLEEVKPKQKRKLPTKKVKEVVEVVEPPKEESVVEPPKEEPVVEPPKEESVVEPPKEGKKIKTVELVECPKCGKSMSKRTLRYDHDKTCPGEPIVRDKIPVQRRIKKQVVENKITIPEEIIEQEIKKRIQNHVQDRVQQRMKLKEERIKKLSAQIA